VACITDFRTEVVPIGSLNLSVICTNNKKHQNQNEKKRKEKKWIMQYIIDKSDALKLPSCLLSVQDSDCWLFPSLYFCDKKVETHTVTVQPSSMVV
jgi:hypothetical protein